MRHALAFLLTILPVAPGTAAPMAQAQVPCGQIESIGVATMVTDGTITLRLRSLPPGPIAESVLAYPPSHPDYQAILKHLGGLAPGEARPVRPWC